ncbi:MAG TPA: class I SAM-dependent methyltransferase [Flavobacterium sp.]|jgi:hypothetical protein
MENSSFSFDHRLLDPEIQDYIDKKTGTDISSLALGKNPFSGVLWADIMNQISAKSKAKDKLPPWYNNKGIIYPGRVPMEQTSSETTAQYKATIVSGEKIADLTGGFGVDSYYFSKQVTAVTYCEQHPELAAIAAHNFIQLGAKNINSHVGDSIDLLRMQPQKYDWLYADPARRNEAKGKVFMLRDCLPNVPDNLEEYFSYADNILIKTSPILDISAGISELENVAAVHVVAVKNEVKELLYVLKKGYNSKIKVCTVNFARDTTEKFEFTLGTDAAVRFAKPSIYLYEPNAAIMKSGAFDEVSSHFDLAKLHQHSHLYTSENVIEFPGRVFRIDNALAYDRKSMKQFIADVRQSNITTRNFQETPESLYKKWKIKPGGNVYSFFTTDLNNNKIVLICSKIS